ncbi:glycosyltransferase family 2 protein [uncultured Paracoccus sp.]|uniref:glycosyltransferase family 2 protein n=1 Tax=uncultured Paracoccus sp. TaxID=189685 RepID=UPI00262F4A51|nr:glycosyltransferase family 2 protein [uncultured Paracoccus sp.]
MTIASPQVAVLMALHQGAAFLRDQLDSIASQQDVGWRLVVGDDGSTDGGPAMVKEFAALHSDRVQLRTGPQQGAVAQFRALLRMAPAVEFVALADQDDVWHSDKLARAATALRSVPADRPAVYCSRVTICDARLRPIALSRLPHRPPNFRHALVQNVVQGNTVVLNRASMQLLRAADMLSGPVTMHDWWIYQIVSGAGGRVIYDPRPSLLYRQHDANVVGANDGARSRLASLGRMLRGDHARWSRQNLASLTACAPLLTPGNRVLLAEFRQLLDGGPATRLAALRRAGFYRQGRLSQAALWAAAALGRV